MVISAGDSHGSLGWDRERRGCPCPPTAPPVLPEHGEKEPRASSGCPPRAVPLNAHTSQCCALSDPAPPAPAGRREGVEICIRERTRPCRGHCHPSPSPGVPPPPRGDISPACSCPPWGSHPRELLPLPHATLSPPSAHNLPVGVGGPCPPPALTPTGPRQPSGATGGRGGGGAAGPRSSPASPRVPHAPGGLSPPPGGARRAHTMRSSSASDSPYLVLFSLKSLSRERTYSSWYMSTVSRLGSSILGTVTGSPTAGKGEPAQIAGQRSAHRGHELGCAFQNHPGHLPPPSPPPPRALKPAGGAHPRW